MCAYIFLLLSLDMFAWRVCVCILGIPDSSRCVRDARRRLNGVATQQNIQKKKSQSVIIIHPFLQLRASTSFSYIFCTHQRPVLNLPGCHFSPSCSFLIRTKNRENGDNVGEDDVISGCLLMPATAGNNHQLIIRNYKSLIMNHLKRKTMAGFFFRRVGL